MNINFANGKSFEYFEAYAIEKDYYDGETRQSIEIYMPIAQTSYDEIYSIINDRELMNSFVLVGDPAIFEDDSVVTAPMNTYEGYVYGDKITVENGILTFKKYKASIAELERDEAVQAVDELLLAMEV